MSQQTKAPHRGWVNGHHVTVSIDEASRKIAKLFGSGNISRGARKALRLAALSSEEILSPASDYDRVVGGVHRGAVHLDDVTHALAALLGQGNVSAGIRRALRFVSEQKARAAKDRSVTVVLDDEIVRLAAEVGKGDVVVGIRLALQRATQPAPARPYPPEIISVPVSYLIADSKP